MQRETTAAKWGNSLAIRIPQGIAKQARIDEGDSLTLDVLEDGAIVVRSSRKRYRLEDLVSGITPRNRHRETHWGGPAGKEAW